MALPLQTYTVCCPYLGVEAGSVSLGFFPSPSALVSVPLMSVPPAGAVATTSWSHLGPVTALVSSQAAWLQSIPTAPLSSTARQQPLPVSLAPPEQPPPSQPSPAVTSSAGFSLSPATEPFPQKLVDKIRSGMFVEMRDLLSDNIALLQQIDAFSAYGAVPSLPGVLKPRLREVASLPSWLYCFLAYIGIQSSDQATRDMLAYSRLIIREAQRLGGVGWLDYDRVFRQQAAIDRTLPWNTLHPGIQASTLVGYAVGPRNFCRLCRGADHAAVDCALAYLQQQPPNRPTMAPASSGPPASFQGPPRRRRTVSSFNICSSWNQGRCIYPGTCTFRHVCSLCYQQHRALECNGRSRGSEFGRGTRTPARDRAATSQPNP